MQFNPAVSLNVGGGMGSVFTAGAVFGVLLAIIGMVTLIAAGYRALVK